MSEPNTRGEVTLELDGAAYVLRPSYEALQAIEDKTGMNAIGIINALAAGRLPTKTLAVIVTELVKAWGGEAGEGDDPIQRSAAGVNADKIGKLIFEQGQIATMERVSLVLTASVNGGCNLSGELKPAP